MTKSHLHAARDAIQTQIASHERQIQDLRTKLNEILPISGLPDEVLCHTFMYLKSLVHPDDTSLASSPRAWISITTHVCRRWRNAAINYAPLWTSLTSRLGPTWFGEMLERSQGALLSLEILTRNTFRARGVHCWQQLATQTLLHPSRLSDVVLDVFATTLKELVLALRVPFPKITRLVLRSHESGFTPPIWLPADLLGGDAPQLQELLLEGCILPWTSPILQTITTLTWSTRELEDDDDEENEDDEETFTFPFNHALNALCKMPQLIHLDLGVQISKPYDPSSVKDIASLPNLKELRLKGGCAKYGSLLACLRIPTQCVLHLNLARADEADISALGEALKSCWLAPPSPSDHPIPFDRLTIAQISSSLWCNDILKILCYNPCKEVSLNLQLGISIPNWNTNFTQTHPDFV
ncbi:hypothetical protein BKA70DRAFT_1222891 [Coprinopsis sp. MPI-PUGE-AT-0042]|nr:hypothetical protein BKA70DRAFT_1222891 [Coprinopsis sp. MPI-PUGE-AT-0042]